MQKLITYLKQGKGRGLRGMLLFSILATLISWWMYYSTLEKLPQILPTLSSNMLPWIHVGFIVSTFVFIWLLYWVVVGISALLAKIFQLKLMKGLICRSAFISIVSLFILSVLFTVIAYLLNLLGETAVQFYPIVIMVLLPILLVMLIACGLAEQKEGKKKK